MYSQAPQLTSFLTAVNIAVTTTDGKTNEYTIKAGFTLWFEAETHIAINASKKPVRVYLLKLK